MPLEQVQACHEQPDWDANYESSIMAFARLYIFADKYRVHQLKDGIATALLAQSQAWNWWTDPEEDLIPLIYGNLPRDCGFINFVVLSAAFVWL